MKKRIVAILLLVAIVMVALTACSKAPETQEETPAATAAMAEFYGAEITDASGNNHSYSFYSTEYPELRATIVNATAAFFAENLK